MPCPYIPRGHVLVPSAPFGSAQGGGWGMFRERKVRVRGPEGAEAQAEADRRRLWDGGCRGVRGVVVGAQRRCALIWGRRRAERTASPQGPDPKARQGRRGTPKK